jgi:hypothetical protein
LHGFISGWESRTKKRAPGQAHYRDRTREADCIDAGQGAGETGADLASSFPPDQTESGATSVFPPCGSFSQNPS